jgi:multisubunit Na+/H+ antiporter MnhC subunit
VTLGWKLFAVFLAFLSILAVVIVMAFRERKQGRAIAANDVAAQQAQDARVMTIIFTAIVGGMGLTILVAWLVFF